MLATWVKTLYYKTAQENWSKKGREDTGFVGTPTCPPFHCSVHQYGLGRRGGEGEVGEFFFMWKQHPLFFIDPPSGEGTAHPQTQQSLISWGYTAILCVVTEHFSPLREDTKNSLLHTHRTWIEKGIWTIAFVGLGLVTYWNSLCPRLEKWKLCR